MKTICSPGYHHNGFAATQARAQPYIMYPSARVAAKPLW